MKAVAAVAALAATGTTLWCGEAVAYRPFDGTDAAVADTGDVEIELGPVEYLREGAERTLLAPDLRIKLWLRPGLGSITGRQTQSWSDRGHSRDKPG
jgi:hypothetical protein